MNNSDSGSTDTGDRITEVRFRCKGHPGDVSLSTAFGRLLVVPITATVTPAMIVGVVLVLQGWDPLGFIAWAFPLALALASLWTWYRVRALTVEIVVTTNGAAALSLVESLQPGSPYRPQRVFDIRSTESGVVATIGLSAIRLEDADWEDLPQLSRALRNAKDYYA